MASKSPGEGESSSGNSSFFSRMVKSRSSKVKMSVLVYVGFANIFKTLCL